MKTKLIVVEGRKYRPLKVGEMRLPGDVWEDGRPLNFLIGSTQQIVLDPVTQAYRPLKTPPKKKREVKGVKVWLGRSFLNPESRHSGSFYQIYFSKPVGQSDFYMGFALTPLPSGKKGRGK